MLIELNAVLNLSPTVWTSVLTALPPFCRLGTVSWWPDLAPDVRTSTYLFLWLSQRLDAAFLKLYLSIIATVELRHFHLHNDSSLAYCFLSYSLARVTGVTHSYAQRVSLQFTTYVKCKVRRRVQHYGMCNARRY